MRKRIILGMFLLTIFFWIPLFEAVWNEIYRSYRNLALKYEIKRQYKIYKDAWRSLL